MQISDIVFWVWGVALAISIILHVVEFVGMMGSYPYFLRLGVKVKTRNDITINFERFEIDKGYRTKHANFRRINENSCVFCHWIGPFSPPLPIKGEIVKNDADTLVIWRLPLGTTLFLALWLPGLVLSKDFPDVDMLIISIIIFVLLWLTYSTWSQKRARLALSEIIHFSQQEPIE